MSTNNPNYSGSFGFYRDGATITPSDSTDLTTLAKGVYCGGLGGTIRFITERGTTLDGYLVQGAVLPFIVARVKSTGTSATGLIQGLD